MHIYITCLTLVTPKLEMGRSKSWRTTICHAQSVWLHKQPPPSWFQVLTKLLTHSVLGSRIYVSNGMDSWIAREVLLFENKWKLSLDWPFLRRRSTVQVKITIRHNYHPSQLPSVTITLCHNSHLSQSPSVTITIYPNHHLSQLPSIITASCHNYHLSLLPSVHRDELELLLSSFFYD